MTDKAPTLPAEPERPKHPKHPNERPHFNDFQWTLIGLIIERELLAERGRAEKAEKQAAALWALLDDIDTASDMFKSDYEALAKYVYRTQRRRFEFMTGEEWERLTPDAAIKGAQ